MRKFLLLSITVILHSACCNGAASPANFIIDIPINEPIENLPGANILNPTSKTGSIEITLTAATLKSKFIEYTAPVYVENGKTPYLFGPTIRIAAGDAISINLQNNLSYAGAPLSIKPFDALFTNLLDTSMHTHGMVVSPGVFEQIKDQDGGQPYTKGDNIFTLLHAKKTDDEEPRTLKYRSNVPDFHLPGLYWYHPHQFGGSGLQTSTANGLVIVEDNPVWLPDKNGCSSVRNTLATAKETLLHFELLAFAPPVASWPEANADLDDTSIPVYGQLAKPSNPYCCGNDTSSDRNQPLPLTGTLKQNNTILLNGGYQPIISLTSGEYQRWRLLHSGYKRYLDLQIIDPATNLPTDDCELLLVAKDGVYLHEIPRTVNHMFLAPANRAELLVRCTPKNGTADYLLSSGIAPDPFCGPYFSDYNLISQNVASIRVSPGSTGPQDALKAEACTPLRPMYASDLRNASLIKNNALDKLVPNNVSFTFGDLNYGCLVNGANFTFPDPNAIPMPLGKVVEWPEFLYLSEHPLHTHTVPYQIMSLPTPFLQPNCSFTSWFRDGDWQDTLYLPMTAPLENGTPDTNVLRFQPGPFTGYTVMHCHLLQHEDGGCMKVLEYFCDGAPVNSTERLPIECPGYQPPVPGSFMSVAATPTGAANTTAAPITSNGKRSIVPFVKMVFTVIVALTLR